MKKKPQLDKLDVRMPADILRQLRERANLEVRSANQQAVHYIKNGLSGTDDLRQQLDRIESLLHELLRRTSDR